MKKVVMGLIALVLCFSSFKGMAQGSESFKKSVTDHSMAMIIEALKTVYAPDMSREEFSKKLNLSKEMEINEGKEFVDQLYNYCSKEVSSEEIMKGDNSSLIKFVDVIIKGGSTGPTNPNPASLARRPWWKKVIGFIIKTVAILVGANNPDIKEVVDNIGDAVDGALGD